MKKVMFLMAVAGMFAFAACNNNAETETTDTLAEATEQVIEETAEVVDSAAAAVEGAVEEAVVAE